MICKHCGSGKIMKKGKRRLISGVNQIYLCRNCNRRFVNSSLKGKSFDARAVLNTISYYNLGNTLEQSSRLVNKKFKVKTSKSVIHKWLNEFKDIYSYHRIRSGVLNCTMSCEVLV